MIIHFSRFTTRLPDAEVRRLMEERAPHYREVPGLIQKYYGRDPETGAYCGCYVFETEEARQAFRESELARSMPDTYEVVDRRVEGYDVIFPLYNH